MHAAAYETMFFQVIFKSAIYNGSTWFRMVASKINQAGALISK